MSTKLLNTIAVLFMLLSVGLVAAAISASTQRIEIQGPSALAVLPDRSVWLSVDDALWRMDENGKRLTVADAARLGVGGRIGNLVVHPNGQLVAQVRNDPTLYFLDPQTGVIQSRLVPQWPSNMERDGSDAINYAFNADGRVAISNGGGHAVALFDATGRFLARTAPGAYAFTNGLWWQDNVLWTTDTNRQQLVELDGGTLAEKSRVTLATHTRNWRFLGMAAASHGKASALTHMPPLATIIRFANGMTQGHATDVFADGSQMDYPADPTLEPRDIKWRGNELMLVDNASFTVKRYTDNRQPMADFGDAQVQSELKAAVDRRTVLQLEYDAGLFGAVLMFIVGLVFALRAQSREKAKKLAALNIDLSQLGTPILVTKTEWAALLKYIWPMILAVIVLVLPPGILSSHIKIAALTPQQTDQLVFALLMLVIVLAPFLMRWNVRRFQQQPAMEVFFNFRAVRLLQESASIWKMLQPDELPQETLMIKPSKGALNWLVLTNRRLLVFATHLKDTTLVSEYLRKDILRLHIVEKSEMSRMQKIQRAFMFAGELIRIEIRGSAALEGHAFSAQTVRRMAAQLQTEAQQAHSIGDMHQMQLDQAIPRLTANPAQDANRHAIASFLAPGLGQWMQRRSGAAFLYFLAWLLALSTALPVAWTLWTRLAAVPTQLIVFAACVYVFICTLAAFDAWHMRERFDRDGE